MTLYQLFTKKPEKEILLKIMKCLGLESLDDTKIFTKKDLGEINALENIKNQPSRIKCATLAWHALKEILS